MVRAMVFLAKSNKPLMIRVGIVGALLCVLSGAGWLITKLEPALFLVALLLPFGILAVVKRIELGIAGMLLAGVFVRFRFPTGTASEIVISMVIAMGCIGLWIVNMLVVKKRLTLKPASINVPILAFIATVAVSWIWSRAFRDPLVHESGHPLVSIAAGFVMALLPACALLAANNVRSVRWLQVLVWIVLGEGLVVLSVFLGAHFGVGPMRAVYSFMSRNGVIHINTQGLLSMWCLAFSLSLALFNRQLHWVLRVLLLAYAGAWAYWGFGIAISWLSGWVPAFAAAAAIAFLRSRWLFVLVAIGIVVGAGGYYWRTQFQQEANISGSTRLQAYGVNWRITGKHILFGTGPAGYASYYMSYFPTEAMASHSNYIDLVAQTGIAGTFFYLWFFAAQAWRNYKLSLTLRGRRDFGESLAAAVLGGTAGCLIAMALGDWLLPFAYTNGIIGFDLAVFNWLFMGSLWALRYNLGFDTSIAASKYKGDET